MTPSYGGVAHLSYGVSHCDDDGYQVKDGSLDGAKGRQVGGEDIRKKREMMEDEKKAVESKVVRAGINCSNRTDSREKWSWSFADEGEGRG